jgi:hypothetical protein
MDSNAGMVQAPILDKAINKQLTQMCFNNMRIVARGGDRVGHDHSVNVWLHDDYVA